MLGKKGFSLLELLVVLIILSFIILLFTFTVLKEINKARGSALLAGAREVYAAAQLVLIEKKAANEIISDEDYMSGLTGIVDDMSLPEQTNLSKRMQEYIMSDVVFAKEPGEGKIKVNFVIENGELVKLTYDSIVDRKHYTVTIEDGESTVTQVKD